MNIRLCIACLPFLLSACAVEHMRGKMDAKEELARRDPVEVPTVTGALENSAVRSLELGDFKQAASLYSQLLEKEPKNETYLLGFAHSLRRAREYKGAVQVYDEALKHSPDNIIAMEGRGLALMELGDVQEASQSFKKVLEKEPNRWQTLNALGLLFASKGMHGEAIAYLKEAQRQDGQQAAVLNNLGLVEAMRANYSEAQRAFESASSVATEPQRKQVDLNMALVYGVSGDFDRARIVAGKYLSGAGLENNMGLYAHLANDRELAKSFLNMALAGSNTHYKRAWENLDIIQKEGKTAQQFSIGKRVKVPQ